MLLFLEMRMSLSFKVLFAKLGTCSILGVKLWKIYHGFTNLNEMCSWVHVLWEYPNQVTDLIYMAKHARTLDSCMHVYDFSPDFTCIRKLIRIQAPFKACINFSLLLFLLFFFCFFVFFLLMSNQTRLC